MKHKIIAGLYTLCAVVQLNDPDFYIWVPLYMLPAIVAVAYGLGWRNSKVLLLFILLYTLSMIYYIPDLMSWIKNGTPSITGSMKAETPFVEFIREFFGLGLCVMCFVYYYRTTLKVLK